MNNSSQTKVAGVRQEEAEGPPLAVDAAGAFECSLRSDASLLRGTETILFVEDEEFVRKVASEVLKSAGYVVLSARDGIEAISEFHRHSGKVDLLLSDIVLPGKSGRAVASELRQLCPGIRILFISGYAEQLAGGEFGSEASDHLAKPFSTHALLRKVRQVLDTKYGPTDMTSSGSGSVRRACGSG